MFQHHFCNISITCKHFVHKNMRNKPHMVFTILWLRTDENWIIVGFMIFICENCCSAQFVSPFWLKGYSTKHGKLNI